MSRPGCVWTHSLLIDFADLARLGSADDLLGRFRRPSGKGGSEFAARLEIETMRTPTAVPLADLMRAGHWVSALYGRPKDKIVAERDGPADDELVTAIWMQQWPRLRRAFRFCTFSAEDRSMSADIFDLQLMEVGKSSHSRIPNGVIASTVDHSEWVEILLDDLELPQRSGLRQFLRDVGSDVTNGRVAMVTLVYLYAALELNAGPSKLTDAVARLEGLGSGQVRMGRAAAARVILSRPDFGEQRLFDFALGQVRTDRDLLGIDPITVGRALLRWRPELLAEDVGKDDPLHEAIEAAVAEASPGELVDLVETVPGAAATLLPLRQDVLEQASFWRIASIDAHWLITTLKAEQDQAGRIVGALIDAGRDDCSAAVVAHLGIAPVVAALSRLDRARIRSALGWIRSIVQQTDDLAECMAAGEVWHRPLLITLAEVVDPDAVPNNFGTDPWVTAVERSRTSNDVQGEDLLAACLFARARGWRSRSAGRLFFLSVQRLHEAMASARLTEQAWRVARPKLPHGSIWRDWDQCEKLRHAVVDSFIDRDIPPLEFGSVVNDGRLWGLLVDLAADSSRGRRYLDKVRNALRGGEAWQADRAKFIDRKLR